jgi:hypothetical protein
MLSANALEKRIQIAGFFLIAGLLVEASCLFGALPITFVIFAAVGGLLMFIGVAIFLYSLISTS